MITKKLASLFCLAACLAPALLRADSPTPPEGFRALFNGQNLDGWYGLNPHAVAKLSGPKKEASLQAQRSEFREHWRIENGELVNDGHGPYATTEEQFGDIELLIDYKTVAKADSGIYLRGTPQVQIWDFNQQFNPKAPTRKPHLGSGGLFNNTPGNPGRDPLVFADKPFGQWNQFRIRQVGTKTWVWLNGELVVDGAVMENFWDRQQPLPEKGPIMLQTHGGEIRWRNIFVREIEAAEAQEILKSAAQSQDSYRVYIGTYTGDGSKGIYQCELNLNDGSLSAATLAGETSNPSFLAFHPNRKFLYAVNEREATISAFAVDNQSGKLTFLNSQPSQGGAPCHLVVDPTGQNVLAANYSGGSCICIPIAEDGKLSKASSFQQHQGAKTNGHSIHLDQANRFALCCDLGLDKVLIYAFDAEQGQLTPHDEFETPKGAGPRHFAWHPNGKTAFINGESDLTIINCEYDADKGALTSRQVLSTLPADVVRQGGSTAETVVHPSGKFVYVSNRDPYNSIAIFAINPQTHALTLVGHQHAGIKTPRNFAIEPTGQFMLVANQSGGNVIVFKIDQSSGQLTPTDWNVKVPNPVCVRFMELK